MPPPASSACQYVFRATPRSSPHRHGQCYLVGELDRRTAPRVRASQRAQPTPAKYLCEFSLCFATDAATTSAVLRDAALHQEIVTLVRPVGDAHTPTMSTSTILGFDDLGDRVIAQQLEEDAAGAATMARPPSVPLVEWYELDRTTAAICDGGYKRVALQFPDRLLPEAGEVATQLGDRIKSSGARTFVLGDTSFGSCCVDEVAAAVRGVNRLC